MKPPLSIEGKQETYVPLEELVENMRQNLNMPYHSVFSFVPLMLKMNQRIASSHCEMTSSMLPMVEQLETKFKESNGNISDELRSSIDELTIKLLPSMYFEGEYGFISPPFIKEFYYTTPAMEELMDKSKWMVKVNEDFLKRKEYGNLQNAAAVILNKFYGQEVDLSIRENLTFRHVETGREIHLRLNHKEDYLEVDAHGPVREINDKEMHHLLNNFKDDEVVLEYIPVDNFTFRGIGIGLFNNVTDLEIQSLIKDSVLNIGKVKVHDFMIFLKQQMNDYLERDDLEVGMADMIYIDQVSTFDLSLTGLPKFDSITKSYFDKDHCYPYLKAYCKKENVIVADLLELEHKSKFETALIENGYRSLLLIPLADHSGEITTIVELASKSAYAFDSTQLKKLVPIIELLELGNEVFQTDFNNKVDSFIKSKFTAIHPSVEWKFEEIARNHQILYEKSELEHEVEPIVFADIYPLYAQADIRNSSEIRNNAIQEDLIENLEKAIEIMNAFFGLVDFHLLDAYNYKAQDLLGQLRQGYTSGNESEVVDLLTHEIHPLLNQLQDQFPEIPRELMEDYQSDLDDELGIVSKNRRDYEKSVNRLNNELSGFIEKEDAKMQQILPHYFEKYKTDGVEFNLYIGQSILKNEKFSDFHLKDFRLWQLVKIVEMTQLSINLKPKLKIPLDTAQLIFVYNSSLSIRFRMDEKQFDVDGSYNVRYEILKKRIDKARIKGTNERLSQAGKIAIVYLLDKDRKEYMEYLNYLISKGKISSDIEDLELERLQGADGLRSLRVTVLPS